MVEDAVAEEVVVVAAGVEVEVEDKVSEAGDVIGATAEVMVMELSELVVETVSSPLGPIQKGSLSNPPFFCSSSVPCALTTRKRNGSERLVPPSTCQLYHVG